MSFPLLTGAITKHPMRKIFTFAILCLAASLLSADEAATWTVDYSAALKKAKAENRQVMLLFTGSDWCIWCKRLQAEILSKPEFTAYAGAHLVLVELDFPRQKEQPPALKAQNEKLAEKYGVDSYPTVIVLNADGGAIGQLGYMEGGPAAFLAALKKF